MKLLAFALTLFALSQSSYGKDITVGEAFTVSVPDSAVEQPRSDHSYGVRDTILQKYKGDSFWLGIYRWPNVKADSPPNQIPEQWKQGKEWALISEIVEGSTASGIPYVTFKARMVRDGREPFNSIMTVLRSSSGAAFMFQMTGDAETIDAIRKSIRNQ
jgi:hypothetical protein